MKTKIWLLAFVLFAFLSAEDTRTITLSDGTIVSGTITGETESSLIVKTNYGIVTIQKSDLLQGKYEVTLMSGEKFIGIKVKDSNNTLVLKTVLGEISIDKSKISILQEIEPHTNKDNNYYNPYYRPSLFGLLFGSRNNDNKNLNFSLGKEQLIDLFFDPTGYTLDQSTLYLSGLSFGFGITDNFQITTKWSGFFWGDVNIRPKLKVFEVGNWESQTSFSIGGHYHSRWLPNKYEWKSGQIDDYKTYHTHWDSENNINVLDSTTTQNVYWGDYYLVGSNPTVEIEDDDTNYHYWANVDSDFAPFTEMIEVFGAITHSTARKGVKGRISHTIGGNIQYLSELKLTTYRVYYGLDVDITSKIKMIGEVFYDPFYFEYWQRAEDYDKVEVVYDVDYSYIGDFYAEPLDKPYYNPIHFDFGFMYAFNESFRFGMHFQQPWIAFYWKF